MTMTHSANMSSSSDLQTLSGLTVKETPVDEEYIRRLVQAYQVPEILARLLYRQNISETDVQTYLYPTLKNSMPDPLSMAGMAGMVDMLSSAIMTGETIGILADFDVDGATSSAIFYRYLKAVGVDDIPVYIPDRLKEGYGPNTHAFDTLKSQGASCVLLMDCGITAHVPITYAKSIGLRVGIADHHDPADTLPPADVIVDPKRPDDISGLTYLAACGVVFMICVALNRALRDQGYFKDRHMPEPDLMALLDLVALGTVCDMVPLIGLNRAFVFKGVEKISEGKNQGLSALKQQAGLGQHVNVKDIGYTLGPHINAVSRMHDSRIGFECLSTTDADQATGYAILMGQCNEERKIVEKQMVDQAIAMVARQNLQDRPIIILHHPDWHEGVRGLVASKIKERFLKPALALSIAGDETNGVIWGGSGRSVEGVDLGACFRLLQDQDVILKGGGHAMAAGLTVHDDKLQALITSLEQIVSDQARNLAVRTHVNIAGVISVRAASSLDFFNLLERAGPFGRDNSAPVFLFRQIRVHQARVVNERHIFADVSDWEGGARVRLKLWQGAGTLDGDMLLRAPRQGGLTILGALDLNRWQGRETVEITLSHVCRP